MSFKRFYKNEFTVFNSNKRFNVYCLKHFYILKDLRHFYWLQTVLLTELFAQVKFDPQCECEIPDTG